MGWEVAGKLLARTEDNSAAVRDKPGAPRSGAARHLVVATAHDARILPRVPLIA